MSDDGGMAGFAGGGMAGLADGGMAGLADGGMGGFSDGGMAGEAGAIAIDPACSTIPVDETLAARLRVTADNECDVYLNGVLVGSTTNWQSAVTFDVEVFVHPGRANVIAISGTNTSSQDGNDRGIIGELTVTEGSDVLALVVTDASWRVSTTEETGWEDVEFDDSGWIAATELAPNGSAPWGDVMSSTTAMWIWSAPIPNSTSDKPNLETAWVRRVFYFTADGIPTTDPGCPTAG